MAIFTRRRLQAMLDELAPFLSEGKARDMVARLNKDSDVDQALPAEIEVGLTWALSKIGKIEIEPDWWPDGHAPDVITDAILGGPLAAVEIVAFQDRSLLKEAHMEQVASIIMQMANKIRRGVGEHLYFEFHAELRWVSGMPTWFLGVPEVYKSSTYTQEVMSDWIKSGRFVDQRLLLSEGELRVAISYKRYKPSPGHRCTSKMPASVYSQNDNPLFKILRRKLNQLRAAPIGMARFIFLADVGSQLVSRLGKEAGMDALRRKFNGSEIIFEFLKRYGNDVDGVVTFSPKDTSDSRNFHYAWMPPERYWEICFFGTNAQPTPPQALGSISSVLPAPRYDGITARDRFRQGRTRYSGKGQYRGMSITMGAPQGKYQIEMSVRMFLDLLGGRLEREKFYEYMGEDGNIIKHWLDLGFTMQGVKILHGGLDADDDTLVLEFSDDPAARQFHMPVKKS